MEHPLHAKAAEELEGRLEGRGILMRDPACNGGHHLPLFVGAEKGLDTRMCDVDLLIVSEKAVKVIVKIEESDFKPTKICGKFLQAALATHFIHDSQVNRVLPYDERVLFVEVIDGSKCLKPHSRQKARGELIESEIQKLLPLDGRGITHYRLFFIGGEGGEQSLGQVGEAVSRFLDGA